MGFLATEGYQAMAATDTSAEIPLRRMLSPGQPIIIEGISANGDEWERWGQYQSRIQKVLDSSLVVSAPRRRGTMVRFYDGTDVTVYVNRCGVRLCFQAIVSNPPDCIPLIIHLVEVSSFRKHDRREYVRVELMTQPIEFVVEGDPRRAAKYMAPLVTDISMGGLGLSCLQDIPQGAKVRIALDLPKFFGHIEATAEVRRVFDPVRDNTGKRRWHMGLRFVSMGEADRDRIAAYVLYQQEKMKKVGTFTNFTGSVPDETAPVSAHR